MAVQDKSSLTPHSGPTPLFSTITTTFTQLCNDSSNKEIPSFTMSPATSPVTQLYKAGFRNVVPISLACVLVLFLLGSLLRKTGKAKQAPSLPETIPFVSNSLQYMTDIHGFCRKAA